MDTQAKQRNISRIILIGLWGIGIVYILALLKIILFKYGFTTELRSFNFIPFKFIGDYSKGNFSVDVALKNVVGNVAIFIPMGMLILVLFKKINFKKSILICFLVSLSFELIQYIVGLGASDTDDLILNTLGAIVGILIYKSIENMLKNKIKVQVCILGFLGIFGMTGFYSLYLYQPNILPTKVEIVNEEIVGDLDLENRSLQSICIDIDKETIATNVTKQFIGDNSDFKPKEDGKYEINDNTKFFMKKFTYEYSPNGNIQKTIITYSKISKKQLYKFIKDEPFIDLWINNNVCDVAIIDYHE
ncbi:VanZ family protein [Romboutsia sp.]|uniref:VanZ family protein n=1 Tax=Romboutsia sp. TaxID=1965302 RepID=UPI003F39F12D